MRTSIFITVIVSIMLTGCSVHKSEMTRLSASMPAEYSNPMEQPSPLAERWWERFNDKYLNALMEEAFRQNLDIAQAHSRLEQLQAVNRITGSAGGLNLNIEGSASRSRQGGGSQSGLFSAGTFNTYSLSTAASYEIDIWRRLGSATEAAHLDALASEEDLKSLYISISAQLSELYFLAAEQSKQIELADRTIASFEDTLKLVERRYRSGLVPAIDIYQSRQNLASARAQKPLFESNLAKSLNAISLLTASPPEDDIDYSVTELRDAPLFSEKLSSSSLMGRPDIKAAFLRLKASDKRIGAAIADRFPSFSLVGSYGGSSDELKNILDSPNIFWNILLQAAQPVLDAGRRRAEVSRTEAVFEENLAAYHKTILTAFREVKDALAMTSASEQRIKMLEETVSASDNSIRLALDRYRNGLTDYIPVLTEQVRNATSKSNLLAARRQLISDRIQLVRALGGDWTDDIINEYLTGDE